MLNFGYPVTPKLMRALNMYNKEYIQFEIELLGPLQNLWFTTNDEELRKIILDARVVLDRIFNEPDTI